MCQMCQVCQVSGHCVVMGCEESLTKPLLLAWPVEVRGCDIENSTLIHIEGDFDFDSSCRDMQEQSYYRFTF